MQVRTLGTVKYKGVYLPPGTEMDVESEVAKQLLDANAAERLEAAPAPADTEDTEGAEGLVDEMAMAIEELCQVAGINKRTASILIDQGITDIGALQKYTVEQLAEIKGISKKGAEVILADAAQFEVEDGDEDSEDVDEDSETDPDGDE
jgi:predicted flap endonuclease-1-like 5' DNA nuclease